MKFVSFFFNHFDVNYFDIIPLCAFCASCVTFSLCRLCPFRPLIHYSRWLTSPALQAPPSKGDCGLLLLNKFRALDKPYKFRTITVEIFSFRISRPIENAFV